jgi:hypothetical protein
MQGSSSLRKYEFAGKLTGVAVRHGMQMGLNLAPFVWKELAEDHPLTRTDLEQVDKVFVAELEAIEKAKPPAKLSSSGPPSSPTPITSDDTLDELSAFNEDNDMEVLSSSNVECDDPSALAMAETLGIERYLEVPLSDGSVVPLINGGDDCVPEPLTFNNRETFVRLAEHVRLHEASAQLAMLRKGIGAVLPLRLFSLFTGNELEVLVCGNSQVDVALLRQCTEYEGGVSETDQHVQVS